MPAVLAVEARVIEPVLSHDMAAIAGYLEEVESLTCPVCKGTRTNHTPIRSEQVSNPTNATMTRTIEPGVDDLLKVSQLFMRAAEFARDYEKWGADYEGRRDFSEAVGAALDDLHCYGTEDVDEIIILLKYAEAGLRRRQPAHGPFEVPAH